MHTGLLSTWLLAGLVTPSAPVPSVTGPRAEGPSADLQWLDAHEYLEGQGWSDTAAPFDRLPAKAEGVVRDAVWDLSRQSAGLCARFVSDATELHVRWTLTSGNLDMAHMPASGVSGLDLHAREGDGEWRWVHNARPGGVENEGRMFAGLEEKAREFLLYLPLYNGVKAVQIGIPDGASIQAGPERQEMRPVVFYGTWITQAACASRPGMAHVAILGGWLEREVINLGFSGNGKMELEVARLMAELDAAVYVVDCLPNLRGPQVTQRTGPPVAALRAKRPQTPILLVEDRRYADVPFNAGRRKVNEENRAALRAAYEELVASGVEGLAHLDGDALLGTDGEGTVDGSHPTDLGFRRHATVFRGALEALLTR